ncbi:unnamed protein product, partial [Callosobruchus maculatus]
MLWSRHILVSFVMATRVCWMRPTRIDDQRSEVHKTLNYFTTSYGLYFLMIIVLSIYDHNLGLVVVNTKTVCC